MNDEKKFNNVIAIAIIVITTLYINGKINVFIK